MRSLFFVLLIFTPFLGFGQATIQQTLPEELFSEGMDLMSKSEFGSARQYFERYLTTEDTKYKEIVEYNLAKCALSLYHLDGENLIDNFIRDYPASQLALMAHFDLATYFFQDKNYKKAISHFKQVNPAVLDKGQKQDMTYKLGYSYFANRGFDNAITQFNMLKSKKGKYQILSAYYAGFIEFELKEYDAAIIDLKIASKDVKLSSSVSLMLASVYYKKSDYTSLIAYLEPLLKNNKSLSKNAQLSIFLAEAYYYNKQYEQATDYYQIGVKKLNKETYYNFGYSLSKSNKNEEAIEVLKNVAGATTDTEISASYLLGKLYLQENKKLYALGAFLQIQHVKNKEIAEESMFMAARLSFQLARTTQCITILKEFEKEYLSSEHITAAHNLLAKALVQTNDYQEAITYIESLPTRNYEVKKAYQKATYLLGVEQYNLRKFRLAVENFEKSIGNEVDVPLGLKAHLYIAEAFSLGRKYDESILHYKKVVLGSANSDEKLLGSFGLGYAYYNLEKYMEAKKQFQYFVTNASPKNSKYGRALIRLADCEYVSKDYQSALAHYNRAVNGVFREKDYAYYQIGVVYHIQSEYDKALEKLDRVISGYKSSPYLDDAVFEKAAIYLEMGSYASAISSFSTLISEHPRSKYVPYALEKRALSNFNQKEYARTIADYELFLKKYPYHPSIKNVLLGLQQAYSLEGKSTNFNATLQRFKNANPDIDGLEGVEFDAIKGYYNDGLYAKAAEGFKGYISNYPNDPNLPEAKFILAESLFRQQKNTEALKIYYEVASDDVFELMFKVFERIADLEVENNEYVKAIPYFHLFKKAAISSNQQYRALEGLMKSHYFNASYDSTIYYAQILLNADGTRNEFLVSAHLFTGKSYFIKGDYENANLSFQKTVAIANDENGAEAQYLIGEIKYLNKEYDTSNEALYVVAQKYGNYANWLDKAFLLIADNFIGKGEYFQAKATLESIIENTTSRSTKSSAQNRLKELADLEQKIAISNDTIQVLVKDSIPDE